MVKMEALIRWHRSWLVVLALVLVGAGRANAFSLLGPNYFLAPGQVHSLPYTLLGEQLTPHLDLDGFVRIAAVDTQLSNQHTAMAFPEVNLDFNLQLTATQRIHMLLQPIDGGFNQPTSYSIYPGGGWTLNYHRDNGEPAALWYEGEPFNWLSPRDRLPLDFAIAAGRFPLFFQNGLWFNNIVDGFAISHNNLELGNLSNLNLLYFITFDETQGGLTPSAKGEERKQVMGGEADAEWENFFLEAELAGAYGNGRTASVPQDRNRLFWAFAVTRIYGPNAIALRILGSTANKTQGSGELFVLETGKELFGQHFYSNIFGGLNGWLPVSQLGSAFANEGVLFTFDRLATFPGLNASGANKVGGVLGVTLNPNGRITFSPEIGGLKDNASSAANDQVGVGIQIQANLASFLIPGDSLETYARRGLLYGILLRLTCVGIRNSNTQAAGERFDYGERLDIIYQF